MCALSVIFHTYPSTFHTKCDGTKTVQTNESAVCEGLYGSVT